MVNLSKNLTNIIFESSRKKIAVLIDPDKHNDNSLYKLISESEQANIDFFLVGGIILLNPIDDAIAKIKNQTKVPLILFPGNLMQLSSKADAMLLLSLISGRNPELLIGNQVLAAPIIRNANISTFSTGYMLIGTGKTTSVEYISNTSPIPANKVDIAIATAMAGELLGMKLIYMDGGSGADEPVPLEMIKEVKSNINIPLIIGGGLKTPAHVHSACSSGADIVVVGNVLEKESAKISEFSDIVQSF